MSSSSTSTFLANTTPSSPTIPDLSTRFSLLTLGKRRKLVDVDNPVDSKRPSKLAKIMVASAPSPLVIYNASLTRKIIIKRKRDSSDDSDSEQCLAKRQRTTSPLPETPRPIRPLPRRRGPVHIIIDLTEDELAALNSWNMRCLMAGPSMYAGGPSWRADGEQDDDVLMEGPYVFTPDVDDEMHMCTVNEDKSGVASAMSERARGKQCAIQLITDGDNGSASSRTQDLEAAAAPLSLAKAQSITASTSGLSLKGKQCTVDDSATSNSGSALVNVIDGDVNKPAASFSSLADVTNVTNPLKDASAKWASVRGGVKRTVKTSSGPENTPFPVSCRARIMCSRNSAMAA